MSKEIEEYFIKRLQSYLLEFLQDFSQNNMAKFSLGISSNIVLKNLCIKKQALLNFQVPLYIVDGKINQITLNMPLNYKKQQPELIIEGVDLLVCTIQEANKFAQNKEGQSIELLKQHKLKLWEEQMAKYFEKLSPPNWIQKIVDGIYNNMSYIIKSFTLRFFNYSMLGYETCLRIKFDAYIRATDKDFKQNFNNDVNSTYKLIEIKKLGISFKINPSTVLSKKDDLTILTPIDIEIKYTINRNYEHLTQPIIIQQIMIKQPIIIQLNKEQKNYIIKLNEMLQTQDIIQDNFSIRPNKDVRNNYSEWWKYMIKAIMNKQKSTKLDLGYSSKKLVLMKRYIELYKRKQTIILVPWLSSWTQQDEIKFSKCENDLSLKDLLKYREWAFQEIRIEAKRYYNSSKDGQNKQSVKPLLEIWTNTINNQNSFKDHISRHDDIPIELEDDEKINLYEILERDKTNVLSSYLKGENNHPEQIKISFSLDIHSIFILIYEYRSQSHLKYTPKNTKIFQFCQCKYHARLLKKVGVTRAKQRQSSIHPIPKVYEEIQQSQQIEENIFYSAQELDSFYEDMKDLNEDQSRQSQSSNGEEKLNNSEQKHIDDQIMQQKFVLMLNFIGIHIPLNIYQNGAIQTPKNNKDINLIYIGDIRIIAPGMLLKVMEDKETSHLQQSPLFQDQRKDKQPIIEPIIKQPFQKRYSEFFNEMFDISINNDSQQFLNSELLYQTLGEFLKQNEMSHIKYFLDDYEKNKNNFQDFTLEQFKTYDKYFDDKNEQDPSFIHIIKNQHAYEDKWGFVRNVALQKELGNQWSNCDVNQKHNYLQDAHNKIVEILRRILFIPFIEDYGEFILPVCIQNLKDKFTFICNENNNKEQFKSILSLKITLQLEGEHSEYRIVSNNDTKKNQKDFLIPQQQSQVNIEFSCLQFLLSTKAITSLLNFMEQKKNPILESQTYKQCEEDHKLLQCIVQSKPLHKETQQKSNIKFKLTLQESLKIKIVSEQLSGKIKTELRVQIKNLIIQSINLEELSQDKDYEGVIKKLDQLKKEVFYNQLRYYEIIKFTIEKFSINHKYYSIDYKYYNEELKNNEKNQQQQKSSKDILNSPSLNRAASQQKLKHASTLFSQGEQIHHRFQNNSNKQNKIPGIKQTLLKTQIVILQLQSTIKNHPLLTDNKLYIQIPYFEINVNDSAACLFELAMIINKKQNENNNNFTQEQRYCMSKDSIMRAELLVLQNEHKKQKKDCKHCIIKYRKSLQITNILFGSLTKGKIYNGVDLFTLTEHEVLLFYSRKIQNHQSQARNQPSCKYEPKEKTYGINLQFLSTPKSNQTTRYITAIQIPLLIITKDRGYFKDITAIHCQKSISKSVFSQANSLSREKVNQPRLEKNQSFRYRPQDEINEEQEIDYIDLQPQLMVTESHNLGDKLDDKFIFYCRNKEPEMFNNEYATYEEKDNDQQPLFQKINSSNTLITDPIYLLFYFHKPLRSNLLANVTENYYSEKSSKIRLFFAIESIQAKFPNQFATYNIITILKNIQTIQNVQENVYNIINKDLIKNEKEKLYLKDNPLKILDEVIVCIIVQSIYLKSNETFFKLSQFKTFIQLHLVNKMRRSSIQKRSVQSYIGTKMMNHSLIKNRSSVNPYEEDQIVRCDAIKFNFNQVSQIDITIINVTKHKEELNLSVDDIQISITVKQKESLLVMPGKEAGSQKATQKPAQRATFALHVNLSFQNSYPVIKSNIEQAKILLSQQKVQDLLIAINSFYLISIEEQISLKQHLLNYIFQQELIVDVKYDKKIEQQAINLFTKNNNINKKNYKFAIELSIGTLIVKLQEQDQDFFLFQFDQIMVNKKNNSNLYFSLQQIELRPQNENTDKLIYPNLIKPIDNCQGVVMSLENKIISIQNVQIFLISKYINELQAFKSRIEEILQKNLDELKEKYQKDFDLQLQIKQQEDFQKAQGYFNYKIEISRSEFIIPESSIDSNFIVIKFSQAQLSLNKQKQSYKIPDIHDFDPETTKDKLIIDYKEKINSDYCEFFVAKIDGIFQDVHVYYEFQTTEKMKGQLLEATQINLKMDLPSFEQNQGQLEWTLKDQARIEVTNLEMGLDFGKLLKVQGILEKNQAELSSLFKFQKKMLEKINFQMKLDQSTEVSFLRLHQGDQEKLQQVKEQAKVYKNRTRLSRTIQNKSQSKRDSLI